MPRSPMNTPPPPSPSGSVTSSGRKGGLSGIKPPSYQYIVTAGRPGVRPTARCAGKTYFVLIAAGYEAGASGGPPHAVDADSTVDGYVSPSAQYGWSIKCAPMSPMALTPKSTHPRQLKGW